MSTVCRLYRLACKRWGPCRHGRRLTLSAAAFLLAKAGKPFWRDRIDGLCLLFFGQHRHCRHHYRRETRVTTESTMP